MNERPARLSIRDELGRTRTLSGHPGQFDYLPPAAPGPEHSDTPGVIFGLGPSPASAIGILKHHLHGVGPIRYVEAPAFMAQMGPDWSRTIPLGISALPWPGADPSADVPAEVMELLRSAAILIYKSGVRHFPSFWAPALAALRLARARTFESRPIPGSATRSIRGLLCVMLPGSERELLREELAHGFADAGCRVVRRDIPAAHEPAAAAALVVDHRPDIFFSVNFRGLDPLGEAFHILRRAGAQVAVWLVDNPFHQLSGLESPFWRDTALFVTDASFIEPLKAYGAADVHHLPLAAWPERFAPQRAGAARNDNAALPVPAETLSNETIFVGRSSFPGKHSFFSGVRIAPDLLGEARAMLDRGERPDFFWWTETLGVEPFWPGKAVRAAGLGAEESGLTLRTAAVTAAASHGPTRVFGDEAWQQLLPASPNLALSSSVDYYGPLASIYAHARCVLGATSLLLPAGLTQRHFDVWTAGGLLLSDATPGLDIFPRELTGPITYAAPADIPAALDRLASDPAATRALKEAWRAVILESHTYTHRARTVLEAMGMGQG